MKRRILSIALTLALCLGLAIPTFAAGGFTDVAPGAYYADAVSWAVENGITNGTSETTFSPDDTCTRGQIITFLWRQAGSPPMSRAHVTDIAEGDYFYQAVCWAQAPGLFDGDTFRPNDPCTRLAAVENRFTDVDSIAVNWAVDNEVTTGTSDTTFSPNATCTRGQIATFLYRMATGPASPIVDITKVGGVYVSERNPSYEMTVKYETPRIYITLVTTKYDQVALTGALGIYGNAAFSGDLRLTFYPGYLIFEREGDTMLTGKYILKTEGETR